MIIIKSQDGKRIIEATNVEFNTNNDGVSNFFAHKHVSVSTEESLGDYNIGKYAKEERAKEVMNMITNHICDSLTEKQFTNETFSGDFYWVFEMPKE